MTQPFDDTAKAFYRRFFEARGLRAIAQYEVFARGRSIDLIVECPDETRMALADTRFAHFQTVNALEFKGVHDPLTVSDFNLIMMRAWGLGVTQSKPKKQEDASNDDTPQLTATTQVGYPDERTITIICVTEPTKILKTLQHKFHFVPTQSNGVYIQQHHSNIPVWIIHPSALDLIPENYPLLPLARGKKLEQFIQLCIKEQRDDYLQLIIDIGLMTDTNSIWHRIMELYGMKVLPIRPETRPYIDEFFRAYPEEIQHVSVFRKELDQMFAQGEERGEERAKQASLLRLMRRKFGELPSAVVEQVETTKDGDQLDQWFDQAIDANSLSELDF